MVEVCLVNMPFSALEHPSLAIGLLKASLKKIGIDCIDIYANLQFACLIGLDKYYAISNYGDCADLVGEWVFSKSLFPSKRCNIKSYYGDVLKGSYSEQSYNAYIKQQNLPELLEEIQQIASCFVKQLARQIVETAPKIVGCSSSVQQNCASLALLKQIRELNPAIITIIGGANCEDIMGATILRNFSFLDYVFSGEADINLPLLADLALSSKKISVKEIPLGVLSQDVMKHDSKNFCLTRSFVKDLDALPIPDYEGYFNEITRTKYRYILNPGILIETSRGCWWGSKHRCKFCGLNGCDNGFRQKSPERTIKEFQFLFEKYGINKFEAVDNIIPIKNIKKILEGIVREKLNLSIFYETPGKLDDGLLHQFNLAGVRWIQPGIESLHPLILLKIGKSGSVLDRLRLLKKSIELGIRVSWNLLFGIPEEQDEWYIEMASLFPLIQHLEPPKNMVRLRFDRFSEYFDNSSKYNLMLRPNKAYSFVYPFSNEELNLLAYFFEDISKTKRDDLFKNGLQEIKECVINWNKLFWVRKNDLVPMLSWLSPLNCNIIIDTRECATENCYSLDHLSSSILKYCNAPRTAKQINLKFSDCNKYSYSQIVGAIELLKQKKILIKIDNKYFSLVLNPPEKELLKLSCFPGGFYQPK